MFIIYELQFKTDRDWKLYSEKAFLLVSRD